MLQSILIGHLGGDAEVKASNGNKFTAFRVANTNKWVDADGQSHEETTWVDCILNGEQAVTKYLKKGTLVYVQGSISLRVYSSQKEKRMKAGMTINVRNIELLGGKPDEVPSKLYTEDGQTEVAVGKFFYAPSVRRNDTQPEKQLLVSSSGARYFANRDGWVTPEKVDE